MGKIIVKRKSEWANRWRSINILIDGKKTGTVSNGESKEFDLPAGLHQVKAEIDWCGSPEISFTIGENEKKYFILSGFKFLKWMQKLAIGIIVLHFLAKIIFDFNYVIYLAIPSFLILMYYISFGRKNYLLLEETNDWMN